MKSIPKHIFKLIEAYLSNDINQKGFNELKEWIDIDPKNKQLFFDYIYRYKRNRRLKLIKLINLDFAWKSVVKKLNNNNTKSLGKKGKIKFLNIPTNLYKYAAVALLFFGIAYLYQNNFLIDENKIIKETNSITLELPDGKIKILNEENVSKILDSDGYVVGEQENDHMVCGKSEKKETLRYYTLNIPYGKRFDIELSDGTKVSLNAGSTLKYPVNFIKGLDRKVYLKGEAYFDVSKDKEHPFIVNVDDKNIRVLGTEFNVSSYPEDDIVNTVLVEGSVSIYNKNEKYNPKKSALLTPGFKAKWKKNSQQIFIKKADVNLAIAWLDGRIIFRRTPFDDIVKKLERHYNVKIINNNKVLGKQLFAASFDIETIEEVMESFNLNYNIEYKIQDNTIVIN